MALKTPSRLQDPSVKQVGGRGKLRQISIVPQEFYVSALRGGLAVCTAFWGLGGADCHAKKLNCKKADCQKQAKKEKKLEDRREKDSGCGGLGCSVSDLVTVERCSRQTSEPHIFCQT